MTESVPRVFEKGPDGAGGRIGVSWQTRKISGSYSLQGQQAFSFLTCRQAGRPGTGLEVPWVPCCGRGSAVLVLEGAP